MAGTLVITTLSDGTNSTSATNCIKGSAKAWCNYNGIAGTITSSYNISSISILGVGIYQFNFTTAMPVTPAAIAISGTAGYWTIVGGGGAYNTTAVTFASYINGTGYANNSPFSMVAFAA
jgi:hypothetical protein